MELFHANWNHYVSSNSKPLFFVNACLKWTFNEKPPHLFPLQWQVFVKEKKKFLDRVFIAKKLSLVSQIHPLTLNLSVKVSCELVGAVGDLLSTVYDKIFKTNRYLPARLIRHESLI